MSKLHAFLKKQNVRFSLKRNKIKIFEKIWVDLQSESINLLKILNISIAYLKSWFIFYANWNFPSHLDY